MAKLLLVLFFVNFSVSCAESLPPFFKKSSSSIYFGNKDLSPCDNETTIASYGRYHNFLSSASYGGYHNFGENSLNHMSNNRTFSGVLGELNVAEAMKFHRRRLLSADTSNLLDVKDVEVDDASSILDFAVGYNSIFIIQIVLCTFVFFFGFFLGIYFILRKDREKNKSGEGAGLISSGYSRDSNGLQLGQLFVSNKQIARGSDGTIVFEGQYHGIPVAVKRLLKSHDIGYREFDLLVGTKSHQNIIRWYSREEDHDFVYLSLEKCLCNLGNLVDILSKSRQRSEYELQVELKLKTVDIQLWRNNGYPSPLLSYLMQQIVSAISYLHGIRIVHRYLKPQNILINIDSLTKTLVVKITDMGLSRCLRLDKSSISQYGTGGAGTLGWRAIEQIQGGRQTRAVDSFSLGCVLFFCISKGNHPYGEEFERDLNITQDEIKLSLVEHIPEASDLFSSLLHINPLMRPNGEEVLKHPFLWGSRGRIQFLVHSSELIEREAKKGNKIFLKAVEGVQGLKRWDKKLHHALVVHIRSYRSYEFNSVKDLLRVIRNTFVHYMELRKAIQQLLGPIPNGFDDYFTTRFRNLLLDVYRVISKFFGKRYVDECCFNSL